MNTWMMNTTSYTSEIRNMINEEIPNPLTDKGVQEDIEKKADELMFRASAMRLCDTSETVRMAIKKAAQWGYLEGFRMGWKIHEVRSKKG